MGDLDDDDGNTFRVGIGDHEAGVTGWQATLVVAVVVGMPWVAGIVWIVRTAMYGW